MTRFSKILYFTVVFIGLTVIYSLIARNILPNSDSATGMLEGRDVAEGNIFLHDWNLSTVSFYFTEIIWYALATKIVGYGAWQSYVVPSMLYSALVLSSYNLSKKHGRFIAWPMLIAFAAPGTFAAARVLIPIIHIGTYVYVVICYTILFEYEKNRKKSLLIPYIFLSAITLFSDDISLYILIAPVIISFSFKLYKERNKDCVIVITSCISACVLSKIISFIFKYNNGFFLPGIPGLKFNELDKITESIYLFIDGTIQFFNANIFGEFIFSVNSIFSLIALCMMFVFFAQVISCYRNVKKSDTTTLALAITSFIMVPAYLLSDRAEDLYTIRYVVPFFIFGSILISRESKTKKTVHNLLIIPAVITCLYFYPGFKETSKHDNDTIVKLRNEIKLNKLSDGYGPFWFASSVAINGDISIAPIAKLNPDEFGPFMWLSKNDWYRRGGNFFIVDGKDLDIITKKYGNPIKTISIDDKLIVVYDKNITFNYN
ncbi:TPA: hypothetical protein JLG14_004465 [Escherichia coli]|uniref:hypothetical protein n=1 Tax=Escherichia coli TaxID=562 RepID=UPI00158184B9|nr:hypothetical protein [Escherichia coli]EFH8907726.1 hypothetical protein [Escherichia coli]MDO2596670.1 hypothetical protein [Escherichia coli]HAW7470621.1 hypothetical protein [Escherichia coli]HAX7821495.1 hypothetical protein [Escherichia coli]HAX7961397.1 hypothetical protein [Escherichia coli]